MDDAVVRTALQQGLGAIYLMAFLGALRQNRALLGENGLLPIPEFLKHTTFWETPSIFHFYYSDRFYSFLCAVGAGLAGLALVGVADSGPIWASMLTWFVLWAIYQSIVNTGQKFYGFGWESMLLEAGFFAIFLGPGWMQPSWIPIWCLRWMLFRTEMGAGLIKLRHDKCWKECTCLYYHYETQPIPNPLSWYFHRLPRWIHRGGVVGSHVVQLIVPFLLFAPQPVAALAGALIIFHQLWLIVSGNYAWLNWLTVVLGFSAFSGLGAPPLALAPRPEWLDVVLILVGVITLVLSVQPTLNLFSRDQLMNYSYNPLHLVNTYGAFGSVTRERYEVVLEGSHDGVSWQEYEFYAKPGRIDRMPGQFAPYHLRLDWMMWFLPFRAKVLGGRLFVLKHEGWFKRLIEKLLENDAVVLSLFARNPFASKPPRFVRALYYRYRYGSGTWWERELIGEFYQPKSELELLSGT